MYSYRWGLVSGVDSTGVGAQSSPALKRLFIIKKKKKIMLNNLFGVMMHVEMHKSW